MKNFYESLFHTDNISGLFPTYEMMYLVMAIIFFWLGKKAFSLFVSYSVDEQLTTKDNKAVALSFTGYMCSLGIIFLALLRDATPGTVEPEDMFLFYGKDILYTFLWGGIGIFLLFLSRIINDKILLRKFDNTKELLQDRNIGTGVVECGTYISSSFFIYASLSGEEQHFLPDILSTFIFFIFGQVMLLFYAEVYQKMSRFDVHEEIENDNIAAGVGFSLSLVAVAILISGYIARNNSLFGLVIWFLWGSSLLLGIRYLVDKLLLPGKLLDEEVKEDRNWGAALLEGSMACIAALLILSSL